MTFGVWVKSSKCDSATCVEVMVSEATGNVYIRNSTRPKETISLTAHEWDHLMDAVKEYREEKQ